MAGSGVIFTVVRNVAKTLKSMKDNFSYLDGELKDAEGGKVPPAHSPTWQAVIDDANDMETKLHSLKWFGAVRGDVSGPSQNDCAKYEGVLTAFQDWYDVLVASQADVSKLLSEMKDIKNNFDDRTHAAIQLQDIAKKLAASPIESIRNYGGFTYLDLDKVLHALNGAAGEAAIRITRIEAFPKSIDNARKDLDAYEARMPAMRDYCAHHHVSAPARVELLPLREF